MAIRVTHRRMSAGGYAHEHITDLKGADDTTRATEDHSRAWWVSYVENGGQAYVKDANGDVAYLRVRTTSSGTKYVQTYSDGIWKDNLLALPTY